MIDRSIIGLSGPEFEVPLERGKVREFAASIGAYLPEYFDEPRAVIPPTFLVMSAYFWGYLLERPGDTVLADLNVRHSLDAGQYFTFPGPLPRAGDTLIGRTEVEDVWEKKGRAGGNLTFYKMLSSFRDAATGELVAEWRPVSVETSQDPSTPDVLPALDETRPFSPTGERREQFLTLPRQGWRDLQVGHGSGPITMPPLTTTDVARYAFTSGEDSTGHYDDYAARADGSPSWISVGMLHAGLLSTYAVQWLGPANIRHFESRFHDIIWPADVLSYAGTVAEKREDSSGRSVELDLRCERDGQLVVSGKAVFKLRP
jgi:acyl dehydratase